MKLEFLDELCDKAREILLEIVDSQAEEILDFDSPIEQIFYSAFLSFDHYSIFAPMAYDYFKGEHPEVLMRHHIIKFQTTKGAITPDFMATWFFPDKNKYRSIFVELDGHEFHQKTKKQVERDYKRTRTIQEAGFQLVRFTGSEVYNDPGYCVDRAFELAAKSPLMRWGEVTERAETGRFERGAVS